MKSKIRLLMMACFLFIAGSFMLGSANTTQAQINPDCPNGCQVGDGGCFCFTFYWTLKEVDWGDDQ